LKGNWQVFGRKYWARGSISVTDNFFEIGGHSLKATQIIARVHMVFQLRIPLRVFFANPTISTFREIMRSHEKSDREEIFPLSIREHYDLSQSQKRLWILSQFEGTACAYNMPSAFNLTGKLNVGALQLAFERIIERHESLRTIIVEIAGEPKQKILLSDDFRFKIQKISLEADPEKEKKARQLMDNESVFLSTLKPDH
jgi:hypothetical protein